MVKNALEAKKIIQNMGDLFVNLSKKVDAGLDPETIKTGLTAEAGQYMMYIAASDGEIQWEEAELISEACGLGIATPSILRKFIDDNNIYSEEFENKVPLALKLAVSSDNALIEGGLAEDAELSKAVIMSYKLLGQFVAVADDNITPEEDSNYCIYIKMMEKYCNDNLLIMQKAAKGIKKKTSSSNMNSDDDSVVLAPKKK